MSIETQLHSLDDLLNQLEDKQLDIDRSVEIYGKAVKLADKTFKALDKLETKLSVIDTVSDDLVKKKMVPIKQD